MKLFKQVIEQRLTSYLEDKDDHLFRPSQSIMESFNRGEHVVTAFLDEEKPLDTVWHNGLKYKIFMLDLPTKMTGC